MHVYLQVRDKLCQAPASSTCGLCILCTSGDSIVHTKHAAQTGTHLESGGKLLQRFSMQAMTFVKQWKFGPLAVCTKLKFTLLHIAPVRPAVAAGVGTEPNDTLQEKQAQRTRATGEPKRCWYASSRQRGGCESNPLGPALYLNLLCRCFASTVDPDRAAQAPRSPLRGRSTCLLHCRLSHTCEHAHNRRVR